MRHARSMSMPIQLAINGLRLQNSVLRLWGGLTMAVVCCIALTLYDMRSTHRDNALRVQTTDLLAPLYMLSGTMMEFTANTEAYINKRAQLFDENAALRTEVAALRRQQLAWQQLASENQQLRRALQINAGAGLPPTEATVPLVTVLTGSSSFQVLLHTVEPLRSGQAVLADGKLVGRTIGENKRGLTSVLHILDAKSRIPVRGLLSNSEAIIGGNGIDKLRFIHLPSGNKFQEGEQLVTSGSGGLFWPGIPVGVVNKGEKSYVVTPFSGSSLPQWLSVLPPLPASTAQNTDQLSTVPGTGILPPSRDSALIRAPGSLPIAPVSTR
jgi:rod shape-determining protein MreC